jgi:hypothetical protein
MQLWYSARSPRLVIIAPFGAAVVPEAMPQLLAGAETVLIEAPAPETCLRLIETHRLTSFFPGRRARSSSSTGTGMIEAP